MAEPEVLPGEHVVPEVLPGGHIVTDEDVAVAKLIHELERSLHRETPELIRRVAATPTHRVRPTLHLPATSAAAKTASVKEKSVAREHHLVTAGSPRLATQDPLSGTPILEGGGPGREGSADHNHSLSGTRPDVATPSRHGKGRARPGSRRQFDIWSLRYVRALVGADAVVGGLSAFLAAAVIGWESLPLFAGVIGVAIWPLVMAVQGSYSRSMIGVGSSEYRAVTRAGIALAALTSVVLAATLVPFGSSMPYLLAPTAVFAVLLATLMSLTVRFIARCTLHRRQALGSNLRDLVIVGSTESAGEFSDRLSRETHGGMRAIGICIPAAEVPHALAIGLPVLGSLEDVPQVVRDTNCDAVAVTGSDATLHNYYMRRLAWSLEGTGVEMLVDPGLVEVAGPRIHVRPLTGFSLLHVEEPHFTGWRRVLKRSFDLVATSVGILLISPLLLLIALLVKFQDGGPVLFRMRVVGRGGELFDMLKFRTMVVDAENRKAELMAQNEGKGGLFKLSHDPRITPLGRFLRDFSLDELPQLFNVLGGSMSLVGPRPHLAYELAQLPDEASRRSLVTPGLTGIWQVSGRSDLEGDDAIRLDLRYVENWSLTLDLMILFKTASAVLAKRGTK